MQIALTGTPGSGKTTVAGLLPFRVVDVNALVKGGLHCGLDPVRGCLEADMDALADRIEALPSEEITVLEGHISHHFAPWAVVLRLRPRELQSRLAARGYSPEKVRENVEAEALDVILVEAVEMCDRVDEIDTTGRSPAEVADLVIRVIRQEIKLPPGGVGWLEEMNFDLG